MFTITYRKSNGMTSTVQINAHDSNEAKSIFFRMYDGRIITIE